MTILACYRIESQTIEPVPPATSSDVSPYHNIFDAIAYSARKNSHVQVKSFVIPICAKLHILYMVSAHKTQPYAS